MSDYSKLRLGKKMRTLMFVGALSFTLLFSHFASAFELALICHMPEQSNAMFRYRERTLPLHITDRFYYLSAAIPPTFLMPELLNTTEAA